MTVNPADAVPTPLSGMTTREAPQSTEANSELGQDAFLKLLVAQLKYQDPLNPADGAEFLAQTAQFTMVEKLSDLEAQGQSTVTSQQQMQAAQLVGRQVTYVDSTGNLVEGVVESAEYTPDGQSLTIDGQAVYAANGSAHVAPSVEVESALLNQGYALAGSGLARQGWAVAEGVEAGENLIKYINGGGIKGVKQIMAWGKSMGAETTQALIQNNPGKLAGSLPMCMASAEWFGETYMTVMHVWKTLIDPSLQGYNYAPGQAGYAQAMGDMQKMLTTLGAVASGQATVSSAGYPIALSNLLAGLLAGLPTVSSTYDGVTVNPAVATLGTAGASAGGYSPLSSGQSAAVAMLQNIGGILGTGITLQYDLEQRARTIGSIPAGESAAYVGNVGVNYNKLLSPEQYGEFADTFATAGPGVLDAMMAALAAGERVKANPVAAKIVAGLPSASAAYNNKPTVALAGTYDLRVPGVTGDFVEGMANSKKGKKADKKGMLKAVAYYSVPPADGWTSFEPGAKSPSAALSALKLGGSGVGSCPFTTDQTVAAVKAMEALAKADSAKGVTAAKRLGYKVPGINRDRQYRPLPPKDPAATVG